MPRSGAEGAHRRPVRPCDHETAASAIAASDASESALGLEHVVANTTWRCAETKACANHRSPLRRHVRAVAATHVHVREHDRSFPESLLGIDTTDLDVVVATDLGDIDHDAHEIRRELDDAAAPPARARPSTLRADHEGERPPPLYMWAMKW